jgi:N-acetylmuramoyl-L-alanine amidase
MKIAISSGHGKYVRGASGFIDEVEEARKVVPEVRKFLLAAGHQCVEFHDDTSTTQSENLNTIVNWHNKQTRDVDVSVHFNAYIQTDGGRGCEVLYVSSANEDAASRVSLAISEAGGLINRGAHKRSDLYFLNGTEQPAILLEICFVDAAADVEAYQQNFEAICEAIAAVAGKPEEFDTSVLHVKGKVSYFGGPDDMGVSSSEGLALEAEGVNPDNPDKEHLFLDEQPPGTTGNARRLDPDALYLALRWDYDQFSKDRLAGDEMAMIYAPSTGKRCLASPVDWGPHVDTGRQADVSPAVLQALGGLETDDTVEITYPAPAKAKNA